jgi:hypothetical protein
MLDKIMWTCELVQHTIHRRAFLKTVMIYQVPKKQEFLNQFNEQAYWLLTEDTVPWCQSATAECPHVAGGAYPPPRGTRCLDSPGSYVCQEMTSLKKQFEWGLPDSSLPQLTTTTVRNTVVCNSFLDMTTDI